MRIFRTVATGLLATLVGLGPSSPARPPRATPQAKPERIITEMPPDEKQVAYNAFRLKGKVENPQADGTLLPFQGKVLLTKKACKTCKFRTVRKVKVNDKGVFKARLTVPDRGRWKWQRQGQGQLDLRDHQRREVDALLATCSSDRAAAPRRRTTRRIAPGRSSSGGCAWARTGQTTVQVSPPPMRAARRAGGSSSESPRAVVSCARAWSSYVARSTWRKMPIGDWLR